MKKIIYYLLLLVFIGIFAGFLISNQGGSMSMSQMLGASMALVIYTVLLSLVGETGLLDEREVLHRRLANRTALSAGTAVMSVGLLYQLFTTHHLDLWLLAGLVTVNLTKIISYIYLDQKQ